MKYNYVRVGSANIKSKVADISHNVKEIKKIIRKADEKAVSILVLPELSVTGYTVADLFNQTILRNESVKAINDLTIFSKSVNTSFIVGAPLAVKGRLYNAAFFIGGGKLHGVVPKTYIPNYNEFYEKRWFESGKDINEDISLDGKNSVTFSDKIVFRHKHYDMLTFSIEICEDLWVANPPSGYHSVAGANLIFNPSASNEVIGKNAYRRNLVVSQSARTFTGYIYSSCGYGESTTDVVFGGKMIIAENGTILKENKRFNTKSELLYADIDLEKLVNDKIKYKSLERVDDDYHTVPFDLRINDFNIDRYVDPKPFIPNDISMRNDRCNEIFSIQSLALAKRLEHIGCKNAVIGISGGLDSTLSLLVTYKAFDILGMDKKGILAVTMPGFGTTDRTYHNAVKLMKTLGVSFMEIDIKNATTSHLEDIHHDINNKNVVYENAQARERTQILMDLSNKVGGIVIGTGDLSELALGFATYNGDHMSMYAVNSSVPKTLVRYLIQWASEQEEFASVANILKDVYETPVSPELLPPDTEGNIAQKTESIIGPYELVDFYLYHFMRNGFSPKKILFLATIAFGDKYEKATLEKWLISFINRFFGNQFKRSAMPDSPKVGSINLSPRGDLRMPSDATKKLWLDELK